MKYTIIVTRDVTESTVVDVDAENESDARWKALNALGGAEWAIDDNSWNDSEPVITGIQREDEI